MKLYIVFWLTMCVTCLSQVIIASIIFSNYGSFEPEKKDDLFYKLITAKASTRIFELANRFCLDLVILAHYWNAGDKIRNTMAKKLTNSLSRTRLRNSKMLEENERLQAIRRHEEYKRLADI